MTNCPRCGKEMTETGAPIWGTYCDSPECGRLDIEELVAGVQEARKRDELTELRRLIAKYPEESRQPVQQGRVENVIVGLLAVLDRYSEEFDPDHETVRAVALGRRLLATLRSSNHES